MQFLQSFIPGCCIRCIPKPEISSGVTLRRTTLQISRSGRPSKIMSKYSIIDEEATEYSDRACYEL